MRAIFLLVIAGWLAGLVAPLPNAAAAGAQQVNPLFAQAEAIAAAVASSSMPADDKANFAERFAALSAQQQSLWQLAGEVDSGSCRDSCVDDYNGRVTAWESQLTSFNNEASAALPQGNAQVTLENHTGQTLDLYIDQEEECRALPNLTCTVETKSGFHLLVAASGGDTVASQSVSLKQGESYTFSAQ